MRASMKLLDPRERVLLRRAWTHGVWCASTLAKVGAKSTDECPFCGKAKENWRRLWWERERFEGERELAWAG
eukprot:13171559-Alexandrium_andersonii.AAC.1